MRPVSYWKPRLDSGWPQSSKDDLLLYDTEEACKDCQVLSDTSSTMEYMEVRP